ncbi:MAG: 2-oxo-4-hydroxy-4-carboxy-5-ureidoimidazoline decarboxylase [Myxococcales bacterium]|nr:2-oxo-4-hydroxy-4-carboxy-5-ureidoimidazoline decarboxylase [Myxococcales bacterium]
MTRDEAEAALATCCGSARWVRAVLAAHPFRDAAHLEAAVARAFDRLTSEDWLEAFAAHPRIGEDPARLARFAHAEVSAREQGGVLGAAEATRKALADGNRRYEAIFGHVFLVCATGKSADEMLAILRSRLTNDPATELRVAAGEQRKITALRLAALGEKV